MKRLSAADVFGSLKMDRQTTLWRSMPERNAPMLFDQIEREEMAVPLPPLTQFDEVMADYRTAGLTLRAHPMSFFRERWTSSRSRRPIDCQV